MCYPHVGCICIPVHCVIVMKITIYNTSATFIFFELYGSVNQYLTVIYTKLYFESLLYSFDW